MKDYYTSRDQYMPYIATVYNLHATPTKFEITLETLNKKGKNIIKI